MAAVGFDAVKIATATVGSVFLILDSGTQWDTYNMGVGINGLVKEKPSGAGEIMRNQADDLYMRCHVYDSHTFLQFPHYLSKPEFYNCFTLKDCWVVGGRSNRPK